MGCQNNLTRLLLLDLGMKVLRVGTPGLEASFKVWWSTRFAVSLWKRTVEDFLHTTPSEATKGLKILRRSIQDSWKKVFDASVYRTQC